MVGASELAFRMLVRKYGVDVCSTPMIYAEGFVRSESYRAQFRFDPQRDRPLIVQICSKMPESAANAAKLIESMQIADAVELNVGCPQRCARKGGWGAFLMRSPELLCNIVGAMVAATSLPVLVKMRVFEDTTRTVELARRLETIGCAVLTVHGRTIEKKRSGSRLADWNVIRSVKAAVRIPVVSNGNIRHADDVRRCLRETRCDGVMSACGLLSNPALFAPSELVTTMRSVEHALEYVRFAKMYGASAKQIAKHMHWILNPKRGEIHRVRSSLRKERRKELVKELQRILFRLEQAERSAKKRKDDDTDVAVTAAAASSSGRGGTLELAELRKLLEAWSKEEEENEATLTKAAVGDTATEAS